MAQGLNFYPYLLYGQVISLHVLLVLAAAKRNHNPDCYV